MVTRTNIFNVEQIANAAHQDKLRAIGVLAASINHEVRNPLYIIQQLAESCLERQKEGIFPNKEKALESANDAMKRTVEQAARAMDIIKRLSLFAKAGIDNELKIESVKLEAVLEDVLPLVRYELAAHSIQLIREIPKDLPDIQADRRYLEEILFNLIVNATQAIKETAKPGSFDSAPNGSKDPQGQRQDDSTGRKTPEGQIKIVATLSRPGLETHFKTGSSEGENKWVCIAVTDNGPGIPEDRIKDVFRPFHTTKEEGTGLGLYIVKQLVEKLRGRIKVESPPANRDESSGVGKTEEIGQGTAFTITLPLFSGDSGPHIKK